MTPALAACSKALIETISKAETLPAYTVKAPSLFMSDLVDPNAFTVYARHAQDQDAAREGLVQGHVGRRDRFVQIDSAEELTTAEELTIDRTLEHGEARTPVPPSPL